jgi:hypothetical protein
MTIEQVRALTPAAQMMSPDDLGFATTSFSPDFNPQIAKDAFPGVRTVSLEFVDGKLSTIWIGFNKSFKWKTLEEFVPGMSAELGIPDGAWTAESSKPKLKCVEFQIEASMIAGGPSIKLIDAAARELWEQRRTAKEEREAEKESEEP